MPAEEIMNKTNETRYPDSIQKDDTDPSNSIISAILENFLTFQLAFWILASIPTTLGNALIIWSVFKKSPLRKEYNIGMCSVFLSNCLIGAFTMPFFGIRMAYGSNEIEKQIFNFITRLGLMASSNSLVAVTYDKYVCVRNAQFAQASAKTWVVIFKLAIAWGIAFLASAVQVSHLAFNVYPFIFTVDVILVLCLCKLTIRSLKSRIIPMLAAVDAHDQEEKTRRSLRIVKVITLFQVGFWLFGFLRLIPLNFEQDAENKLSQEIVNFGGKLITMNSFFDPITYMWYSKAVRTHALKSICCRP